MAVLKKILFPGMTEAAQIAVTQLTKKADAANAINALTLTSENTGVDADGHPLYTIGLAIDSKTIVKDENDVLKSGLTLVYHEAKKTGDTEQSAHIALTDKDGTELSIIKVSDLIGNGILDTSMYDATTGKLTLNFKNADGTTTPAVVDLTALFDFEDIIIESNSTGYLSFDPVTLGEDADDKGQAQFGVNVQSLTATAGTVGVYNNEGEQTTAPVVGTLAGVANSLVDGDDVAAKVKTYVDGAIAIEVARVDAAIKHAVKVLDATVKDGLDSVDDTKVATGKHVGVKVVETDGILTSISVVEDDIASAQGLEDEVARAKSAETSIDSVVGLTKAAEGETRTYTNVGEYIGKADTNTVASDIKALDTKLKSVSDAADAIKYNVVGTTLVFSGINKDSSLTATVETGE